VLRVAYSFGLLSESGLGEPNFIFPYIGPSQSGNDGLNPMQIEDGTGSKLEKILSRTWDTSEWVAKRQPRVGYFLENKPNSDQASIGSRH
jgi:hypothetical protein